MRRIYVIGAILFGIALLVVFLPFFERKPPRVSLSKGSLRIGGSPEISLELKDEGMGLKDVSVELMQGPRRWSLYHEVFTGRVLQKDIRISFKPKEMGLMEGQALLVVKVRDRSLWWFGSGNSQRTELPLQVDLTPPDVELVDVTRYIYEGGSGALLFRASQDTIEAAVRVGDLSFRAFRKDGGIWWGLFGIPYGKGQERVFLEVKDEAGNVRQLPLPYVLLPRSFKHDEVAISDGFITSKVYPLLPEGEKGLQPEEAFRFVNEDMRRENDAFLAKTASEGLSPEPLWEGTFLQLPNSQVRASYGDSRTYLYQNKSIGNSTHLAIDLASTSRAPVPAANRGRVLFTGTVGIYGNVVILDHGLGLTTLYAHLSQWNVKKGEMVQKGQIIGYTGDTGFAGGDHLHFAVMISGHPVNPVDWFDQKWMKERILSVLQLEGGN